MDEILYEFLQENPRLIVESEVVLPHLEKAYDFAVRTNQVEALFEPLRRLANFGDSKPKAYLWTDFAPHSFYFTLFPADVDLTDGKDHRHECYMNGGVIYHGPLEDGTRPETFSVNLTPTNTWSIHT